MKLSYKTSSLSMISKELVISPEINARKVSQVSAIWSFA